MNILLCIIRLITVLMKTGKLQIPTIHEGADARKIEQKFLPAAGNKRFVESMENQIIKQQNTLLQKILTPLKVSGALSLCGRSD